MEATRTELKAAMKKAEYAYYSIRDYSTNPSVDLAVSFALGRYLDAKRAYEALCKEIDTARELYKLADSPAEYHWGCK
jgi:hypothetical protein